MIDQFRKEYMWGFTQGNPIKYSEDNKGFEQLIALLNDSGAISIGASYHPYHLISEEGEDLWESYLEKIEMDLSYDIESLISQQSIVHYDPIAENYSKIIKWEDERLFIERNPEFGKFVPFIIPYLSYDDGKDPHWLTELQKELKEKYTAKNFLDKVNNTVRFFLPQPTLILGFDIFDKEQPSLLIDHYVNFLENVIRDNRS